MPSKRELEQTIRDLEGENDSLREKLDSISDITTEYEEEQTEPEEDEEPE